MNDTNFNPDNMATWDKTKLYYEDDYYSMGKNDNMICFQCEHVIFLQDKYCGNRELRCGGESHYLITRYLRLSERWNSKHVCKRHLDEYIKNYGQDNCIKL
jgi:hypothetical protein